MKKAVYLTWAMLLMSLPIFAQIGGIEDSVNDVSDTIRSIFPLLLGVIFLIGFLFNAGHFFGENADLKKGITRVLVFVLIAGAVVGIFTYLIGIVV
ncbi:MAG: hypothetical protein AAGL34_11435 [Bacteroidota bacterium]